MKKRPLTIFDEDEDINLLILLDEQINLSPIADSDLEAQIKLLAEGDIDLDEQIKLLTESNIDLEEQIKLLAEGDIDLSDYIDDDLRDAFIKRRR